MRRIKVKRIGDKWLFMEWVDGEWQALLSAKTHQPVIKSSRTKCVDSLKILLMGTNEFTVEF